jgi:hypothetical protein
MEPRHRFRGIDFASLCSLAGQYDKKGFVPAHQAENRYLVPLKDLQIRAQLCSLNSHWCAFLISRYHSITHPYLFCEKQVFSFPTRSLGFKTVTSETVVMNSWSQMVGGLNRLLPKEISANRFVLDSHWLEIWSNQFCPSMGPNGRSVAMDSVLVTVQRRPQGGRAHWDRYSRVTRDKENWNWDERHLKDTNQESVRKLSRVAFWGVIRALQSDINICYTPQTSAPH